MKAFFAGMDMTPYVTGFTTARASKLASNLSSPPVTTVGQHTPLPEQIVVVAGGGGVM